MCDQDGSVYSIASSSAPDEIRYIGATLRSLHLRAGEHRSRARHPAASGATPLYAWMAEVIEAGHEVLFAPVVTGIPCPDLEVVEYGQIQRHRRQGHPLLQSAGTELPEEELKRVLAQAREVMARSPKVARALGYQFLLTCPDRRRKRMMESAAWMARNVRPWCGTWTPGRVSLGLHRSE